MTTYFVVARRSGPEWDASKALEQQSGWTEHTAKKGHVMRKPEAGWTELQFEYSAFVVLRARDRPS